MIFSPKGTESTEPEKRQGEKRAVEVSLSVGRALEKLDKSMSLRPQARVRVFRMHAECRFNQPKSTPLREAHLA